MHVFVLIYQAVLIKELYVLQPEGRLWNCDVVSQWKQINPRVSTS